MIRTFFHFHQRNAVLLALALFVGSVAAEPSWPQVPDLATGRIPTLAPLVREVTPAVVASWHDRP